MVLDRFLKYVQIDTQSDEESDTFPSTEKQKVLAELLYKEMIELGLENVYFDKKYGYVYGMIPSNTVDNAEAQTDTVVSGKVLGFIAHMDTSPEVSGENVKPKLVKAYDGGDIKLDEAGNYILSPDDFPELKTYIGADLVTTDGSTLLGADDKAGVAEIMSMAEYLMNHSEIQHGKIAIAFTPDEEVGAGVDHFDLKQFGADYAYTVDGGRIGELEYENFNAAGANVTVNGRSVHPGDAKDKMKNASLLAMDFNAQLPEGERPENTNGYQGFYHMTSINGSVENATLSYIIRDHDKEKFNEKKRNLERITTFMNQKYGSGSFILNIEDSYYNMNEIIDPDNMFLIDNAAQCMKDLGITPIIQPIRGGTDGARLSFMGLPCPNICTGGHNYHGRYEYVCVQSMEKVTELLIALTKKC